MAMNVKPTRSELLNLKKKIALARNGYNLLKKKRDGLILEFFEILKKAKSLRTEMVDEFSKAQNNLNIARSTESELYLKALALANKEQPSIELEAKNVMGIKVPKIRAQEGIIKHFHERGYGIITGSAMIDDAAHGFEGVVDKAIRVAEIEISMKNILSEIEKTKRRVNALEFALIPEMEKTKDFIILRLEEMERENIFRMKRIKKKEKS
ncbi:V-type ATP synthase subunit D [Candidatus Woesearchaeota archaeon]|nr:V-type ATP synthase subunit D [Candidatus Woesearchaeota archaeon]